MTTLAYCPKCEKLNKVSLEKASAQTPICGNCKSELPLQDGVQDLSQKGLLKLITNAEVPLIVDFWAEWCGPCKAFAPTFKAAAKQLGGRFIFAKLNTELHPQASQEFQIRSIPTLIIFKNGKILDRQSGAMPLSMFLDYLNSKL